MAFGKKKKNKNADVPQVTTESTQAESMPKRKKRSPMASIFNESVLETVLEDFRSNENFIQTVNGETRYIGLVLDTKDIGGLDKKSRKNEAKGSIIECINSGRIKTFITSELMEIDSLVIIPEPITLAAMDEFSDLTDAPYELCAVDDSGNIDLLGVKTTYGAISELVADDGHIDSLLPVDDGSLSDEEMEDDSFLDEDSDNVVNDSSSDDDIDDDIDEEIPDIENDDSAYQRPVDDAPVDDYDNAGYDDSGVAYATEDVPVQNDVADAQDFDDGSVDPYAVAMADEPVTESEDTIPAEWADAAVVRKFYSEDLGLEVTPEPFNAQFMMDNPYVPFDESRPDGWINNQLNEMARNANLEMTKLHNDNLWVMRERYFRLMAMQCERIRDDLDIHDPTTQYGGLYASLMRGRDDMLHKIEGDIVTRKTAMEKAWHQKLQEVGMDAARAAQAAYKSKYLRQHEQEIFSIEKNIKAEIEEGFNEDVHEMNERRRQEASALLDLGITEVLSEISDMYVSALSDERVRYQELQEEMRAFVNDNREADIARTRTLAAELRQKDKADQVLAEQTAKIRSLTNEFTQKKRDLQSDIERMRAENQARLDETRADGEAAVARVRAEKEELQNRFDDLLLQYRTLDDKKSQEYESRLEEARSEVASWESRTQHLMDVHKKNNIVSTFLLIAALIAALAIGFIGGEYIRIGSSVKQVENYMSGAYQNGPDSNNGN